jgi:hypothetical protein
VKNIKTDNRNIDSHLHCIIGETVKGAVFIGELSPVIIHREEQEFAGQSSAENTETINFRYSFQ